MVVLTLWVRKNHLRKRRELHLCKRQEPYVSNYWAYYPLTYYEPFRVHRICFGFIFWNGGSLGSRLTMATRRATSPAASLRRMWPWPTFEILSPTKKVLSLMGLWTKTSLALWEKEKVGATQVKTMPVKAFLAAFADIGDIEEDAGVQERKAHDQEDDFWGKVQTEEKRRSIPRDSWRLRLTFWLKGLSSFADSKGTLVFRVSSPSLGSCKWLLIRNIDMILEKRPVFGSQNLWTQKGSFGSVC